MDSMECPSCHTECTPGQKFCGVCGHKLELSCARCGTSNPSTHKFCGQCGSDLSESGTITLARSGLITDVNQKTSDILGYSIEEMQGKPFTLFVERDDLVVFFSHWNDLVGQSKEQSFEIALKNKEGESTYLLLELVTAKHSNGNSEEFRIVVNESSHSRQVSSQLQYKDDLLNLVFASTDAINTASKKHLDHSIEDILKKICLFTEADRCFIYSINRQHKRLEPAYQWQQESSAKSHTVSKIVPLTMIKRAIVRLRKNQTYVVNDITKLAPAERYELVAWYQADISAVACHLLYSRTRPIGVIGISKSTSSKGQWPPECVALIKFIGQMISEKLSFAVSIDTSTNEYHPLPARQPKTLKPAPEPLSSENIDVREKNPVLQNKINEKSAINILDNPTAAPKGLPDMSRPMLIDKLSDPMGSEQQPVFPRDDNLVILTCPRCGLQESLSVTRFELLGNAVSVNCPCRKTFIAVLEKRRAFRKVVQLDGHFTLKGDLGPAEDSGSIWGSMVVKDLSKAGLRFSTDKVGLLHPGDVLMVRFHLDNANQALIHKPARVISVNGNEVGCQFEGDDSYDITLGFYFI